MRYDIPNYRATNHCHYDCLEDGAMSWVITGTYKGAAVSDADAQAYLRAVEQADNQGPLEQGVQQAVNQFVIGCKADGIWNAIKASCILAGARTLSGALTPLVGTAPTNSNFVSGDYNRKTGLVGDGSTKYLNSNRANNSDPQNSAHRGVYVTSAPTINGGNFYGSDGIVTAGGDNIFFTAENSALQGASRGSGSGAAGFTINNQGNTTGFKGFSRAASDNYTVRTGGSNTTASVASSTPTSEKIGIFARTPSSPVFYSNVRLAFYSIGESLNLALLDARVTTMINAFNAAI